MNKNARLVWIIAVFMLTTRVANATDQLTLPQMLGKILDTYPTLEVAALQIERSRQEIDKAESTLGWNLQTLAGVSHDVNFINSPSDRVDATVALRKQLESGSQFNISGQYAYEDASATLGPTFPNPMHRTNIDLNYRIPLGQGKDNPRYHQAVRNALTSQSFQQANQNGIIDNLASQVIGVYYDAAITYARLDDIDKAIERVTRLKNYINKNISLGLAEKKDTLQVDAQLKRLYAQRDNVKVFWRRQQIEVGRLLGAPEGYAFRPVVTPEAPVAQSQKALLLEKVYIGNPALLAQKAQVEFADAELILAKDGKEDQLDVILSVGLRDSHGDVGTGTYNQDEMAGAARIQYQFDLDKRGLDASLYQAYLQKQSAETDYERIKHDLKYQLTGLLAQLEANHAALLSNKDLLDQETAKMIEAVSRYKEGRSGTTEIIDFENDLQQASLSYENQRIETARASANLRLLTRELWQQERLQNKRENLIRRGIVND